MSSTTTGPGDDASASLPELAAAEESKQDVCLGFFAVFCFLEACWPSAAPAELACAPSARGLRIWPSTAACAGLRFLGVEPGVCRETMQRPSIAGHAASVPRA